MTIYNTLAGPRNFATTALLYAPNKRRTLMFLGDSITWGFGVTQEQAFPALLQASADAISTPVGSTNLWTARNVQCDDISNNIDGVTPLKLVPGGVITYDNNGPFASTYVPAVPIPDPAIIFDAANDDFTVTPSSPTRYLVVMVKVTGTSTQSATLTCYNSSSVAIPDISGNSGVATVGSYNVVPTAPDVYRFIYDATTTSSAFLLRRTDASGGAACRILSVNPTNAYPQSNYVQVQINARGSYVASDYSANISAIMETIIHPQNETTSPYTNDYPAFVLSVGTVSMYYNQASFSPPGDRRVIVSTFKSELSTLVANLKSASPNSPIFLTYPPIPISPWVLLSSTTRSEYDAATSSVAIEYNLPIIDLRSTLTSIDYTDGLHPTSAGYIKLGAAYTEALRF